MKRPLSVLWLPSALTLFVAAGCTSQPAVDPALVAKYRTDLVLAEEPDDAQTVLEVRGLMFGEEAEEAAHDHDHEGEVHAHDEEGQDHAEETATVTETVATEGNVDLTHDHDGDGVPDHAAEDHDHAGHDHADEEKKPVLDELDVVLVGSVGGVPNPSDQTHPEFPFAKGQAIFFLADPEVVAEMEEHSHQHAEGEECAFCAAHAADSAHAIAVVQFADEKGKLLAVDARDLFDLKENETVVVQGKARIAPGGMLTVDATGLYVRR